MRTVLAVHLKSDSQRLQSENWQYCTLCRCRFSTAESWYSVRVVRM